MTQRDDSDSRWEPFWDAIRSVAFLGLLSSVLSGLGEQRNEFHRMRGYLEALADIERGRSDR